LKSFVNRLQKNENQKYPSYNRQCVFREASASIWLSVFGVKADPFSQLLLYRNKRRVGSFLLAFLEEGDIALVLIRFSRYAKFCPLFRR
jgi:hypothetical protein